MDPMVHPSSESGRFLPTFLPRGPSLSDAGQGPKIHLQLLAASIPPQNNLGVEPASSSQPQTEPVPMALNRINGPDELYVGG
jgi:hypothetical protein